MVYDYSSVQREIKGYEALGKVSKTSASIGKRYVRQALDHFELRHGDRNYISSFMSLSVFTWNYFSTSLAEVFPSHTSSC